MYFDSTKNFADDINTAWEVSIPSHRSRQLAKNSMIKAVPNNDQSFGKDYQCFAC